MRLSSGRDGRRGAALLVVLWLAVAAAGLALALLETSRAAVPESRRAVDAARLRAALRAAVHLTADRLLRERLELGPEGGLLRFELDEIALEVRVVGESGLVDLASASPGLLRALARASGLREASAEALAQRVERLRAGRGEDGPPAAVGGIRGAGDALRPPDRPGLDHPIELLAAAADRPGPSMELAAARAPEFVFADAPPQAIGRWLAATTLGTGRAEPLPELAPAIVRAAMAGQGRAAGAARPAAVGTPGGIADPASVGDSAPIVDRGGLGAPGAVADPTRLGAAGAIGGGGFAGAAGAGGATVGPGGTAEGARSQAGRRSDPAGLYRLEIRATTPGGRHAVRSVRLHLRSGEPRPVRIVDWSGPLLLAEAAAPEEGG